MRKLVHCMPLLASLILFVAVAPAQISLTGTSYTQRFNAIGPEGLPSGFTLVTGATATALGNPATLNTSHTDWRNTTGGFFNYASGNLGAGTISPNQAFASDRAVGVRQTGSLGDPGAGFVFQVANTAGLSGFTLDVKLQSLDVSSTRTTTWRIDYGFGDNPTSFVTAAVTGSTTTGGASFSNNTLHADFGNAMDNNPGIVTIRIVTVTPTTGSGTRATSAIDDFELNYIRGGGSTNPLLAVQPAVITFPPSVVGGAVYTSSYKVTGTNLTSDVVVSATAPFSISTDNISYGGIITIPSSDPALASGKTIYVRFTPLAAASYTGAVNNASSGAVPQVVSVSGLGYTVIDLISSPYTETFDNLGNGLPTGVTVRTGATTTALGTVGTYSPGKTNWSATSGGFFNYASADIGSSEPQSTATDRALGIRQTGSVGDPGGAIVFQLSPTLGKINVNMDFNIQSLDASSTRTTSWRVDYGLGPNPTSFMTLAGLFTTGGSTFSNTPVHLDFNRVLDDQPYVITLRLVALSPSTGTGTRPTTAIDDVVFTWEDPTAKTIAVNPPGLNFPVTNIGSHSILEYGVSATTNLDSPFVITATAPFSVSFDTINFSSSLSVPPADVLSRPIYVRFAPVNAGLFNGMVTNASVGAVSKVITLTGEAIDPSLLSFNFNSCSPAGTPGSGWTAINTTGTQKWACSSFGLNSSNGVAVNGFSGGAAQTNEAWLISPALHLNSIVNMPVLSFQSRGEFTGSPLQLLVSTDYAGDPAIATWTELTNANFPTPPGSATTEWTLSDNIDLSAFKSAGTIYVAFKYTSSPALNAARWTIDDVAVTDQSTLLSVSPLQLNFGEASVGTQSPAQAVLVRAVGNTDITISVPAGYQLSKDSVVFGSSPILIDQATAAAGTTVYVRFAPVAKALKVGGFINVSGAGLNKNTVALTGSSYPKAETFDVAAYNLAFFGSNDENSATPQKITGQINNIATVLQRLNADVVAVEEVSSDSAIGVLLTKLPGHAAVLSNRWSYSFSPPDPGFPPQKIGFIYDTTTMKLSSTEPPRVLFEGLYDSARLGLPGHRITNYPTGTPSSFWSSGRLPYMATFNAVIDGVSRKIRLIVIHAKSSSDAESYNRRVYDVGVLKDSIDTYYRNDRVIILGDYNDRLIGSIYRGATESPYQPFVSDTAGYVSLTYALDSAGRVSFIGGSGLIDHLIATRSLLPELIPGSTDIEDPRSYISNYNDSTASDHLPVYSRFAFAAPAQPLVIDAVVNANKVDVKWESFNGDGPFIVERSADGTGFNQLAQVTGKSYTDASPLTGTSYYRVKAGTILSNIDSVVITPQEPKPLLTIWPNPVNNFALIGLPGASLRTSYTMKVTNVQNNRTVIAGKGNLVQLNLLFNLQLYRLADGVYALTLDTSTEHHSIKFIKR